MEIKTMADVPTGAILECFNGKRYLFLGKTAKLHSGLYDIEEYLGIREGFYQTFNSHFSTSSGDEDYCIKRIYLAEIKGGLLSIFDNKCVKKVIWTSPSIEEMTIAEIEKALGHRIKIVKEKEND